MRKNYFNSTIVIFMTFNCNRRWRIFLSFFVFYFPKRAMMMMIKKRAHPHEKHSENSDAERNFVSKKLLCAIKNIFHWIWPRLQLLLSVASPSHWYFPSANKSWTHPKSCNSRKISSKEIGTGHSSFPTESDGVFLPEKKEKKLDATTKWPFFKCRFTLTSVQS